MTIVARRRMTQLQQRGFPIAQGGFGGWIGDPSVIPPPSAFQMGTAGVVVNERTVLSLMVVASCIRILGDTASGLEPHVYRQAGSRPDPAKDKEIDPPQVIVEPYADIDRQEGDFRRIASLGLNGNQYSLIVDRVGGKTGDPAQVEIINPALLKPKLVDGRKVFVIGDGSTLVDASDIIHSTWISLAGGLVGLNPIEIGVNGFGIPIAAEQYASRYFAQGMHPSGILSIEKPLRTDDARRVADELATQHGGVAQAHTPIVLDSNAKWQQISVTPETAQLLQSRSFSRGEIAGFYGVPGFLVGDTPDNGGPWGKGLQEMVMGFATFSLQGYTRRLDRADSALLPPGFYVRRHVKELFHTNSQMLGEYVNALRMAAIASPNEGRQLVGLPPTDEPGADSIWGPLNSAHNDWLVKGGGTEMNLPAGMQPLGTPTAPGEAPAPDNNGPGGQ